MRLTLLCALLLVGAGQAHGAATGSADEGRELVVYTAVPPVAWLAEAVGGRRVTVHALVRPGQDPHTYAPRPKQVAALARARIYFAVGLPFEQGQLPRLAEAFPDLAIVPVMPDSHAHAHGEHTDPHAWTSPVTARQIASRMKRAYCRVDDAHCAQYRRNYRHLARRLDKLHRRLARRLADLDGAVFFVMHPAWGAFAETYGLKQVGLYAHGKLPGARHMVEMIRRARQADIRAIFVQPQFSARRARVIARATGAKLVELNPMARDLPALLRRAGRLLDRYVTPP